MSYGYGGRNPYDQRGGAPAPQGGAYDPYGGPAPAYGRPYDSAPAMGRDDFAGQNLEMEPLAPNGQQFGHQNDPNKILNECREIDRGIDEIKASLATLATLQQRSLDDSDSSAQSNTNRQLDAISAETMTMYRNFAGRIKAIKQQPESGSPKNAPQVGKIDRKLKAAIQEYQSMDSAFRRKLQDQMARQYRIVRPDATEQEVRQAVEDISNQQQMFSQALLQSDRRGQSRAALSAVENRHQAIQKIESQMIELAELFQDMEALVVQQEAAVVNIEMKGEEVVENLDKGNQEIGTAIVSARNARKWKWWCLGICVLIIIIIIIIVLIYKFVVQQPAPKSSSKRWALPEPFYIPPFSPNNAQTGERYVVPGLAWSSDNSLTPTPGKRSLAFIA